MSIESNGKINFVKLVGKTMKGKNRIREAATNIWEIVSIKETIAFDPTCAGKWLLVTPKGQSAFSKKSRWVHLTADKDFDVYSQ
jgi:hypothetical protein